MTTPFEWEVNEFPVWEVAKGELRPFATIGIAVGDPVMSAGRKNTRQLTIFRHDNTMIIQSIHCVRIP